MSDPLYNPNSSPHFKRKKGPSYTDEMLSESLTINVLGAVLFILAVLVPFLVSYPKFRTRPRHTVVTVTHDRYG